MKAHRVQWWEDDGVKEWALVSVYIKDTGVIHTNVYSFTDHDVAVRRQRQLLRSIKNKRVPYKGRVHVTVQPILNEDMGLVWND